MSTPGGDATERAGETETVQLAGNSFAGDVWVNFKRWNIKAVRNPFVLVVSLVQPIIFLVLFTEVFGNVAGGAVNQGIPGISYETYLVPQSRFRSHSPRLSPRASVWSTTSRTGCSRKCSSRR